MIQEGEEESKRGQYRNFSEYGSETFCWFLFHSLVFKHTNQIQKSNMLNFENSYLLVLITFFFINYFDYFQ
jgi:hypothetical protein